MTPRRRRRWPAIAGAAIVATGLLLGVAAARAAATLSERRDELLSAVAAYVGFPIEAESLSVSWWPLGIVAERIVVRDESPYGPGDLAHADEARFEIALLPLVRGQILVDDVRVQAPVLRVVRGADGGWNLTRRLPLPRPEGREGAGAWPAPKIVVETVRVRGARVSYRDRAIPGVADVEVKDVNLRMRRSGEELVVEVSAQALGGPEGNLTGTVRLPLQGEGPVAIAARAFDLEAARLPEIVAMLRGRLPSGLGLSGAMSATVRGEVPAVWPPPRAAIELDVDARAASLRAARGWIVKSPGTPLDAQFALRAGAFGLAVDRAELALGRAKLVAEPADGEAPGADAGQMPLRFAAQQIEAAELADWIPALAAAHPTGSLSLDGRLTPQPGPIVGALRFAADRLGLEMGGRAFVLTGTSFNGAVADDGQRGVAALSVASASGGDLVLSRVEVALGGPFALPVELHVGAARVERGGEALERFACKWKVGPTAAELESLHVAGLGGELQARGALDFRDESTLRLAFDPEWRDLDLAGIGKLIGQPIGGQGRLGGRARLSAQGGDLHAVLGTVRGSFSATLADGSLEGLNLASATLANLDGVPRLREAVVHRAKDRVPGLLERTSAIRALHVEGQLGDRGLAIAAFELRSVDYEMSGKGEIGFDGEVDLGGTLSLTPAASQELVAGAGILAVLAPGGGPVRIPIAVRGTYPRLASAPTAEFVSSAVARMVSPPSTERGLDLLRRLFRGRGGSGT